MTVLSLVVAFLAVVVAAVSYVSSNRKAGQAIQAARDSASAARDAADAALRSAKADEISAALAVAESEKYSPPWRLERIGENAWLLRNASDEPAYNVTMTGLRPGMHLIDAPEDATIGKRVAIRFMSSINNRTGGSPPVQVVWSRTAGGPLEAPWEHPLA
jgi:hypothetical protein